MARVRVVMNSETLKPLKELERIVDGIVDYLPTEAIEELGRWVQKHGSFITVAAEYTQAMIDNMPAESLEEPGSFTEYLVSSYKTAKRLARDDGPGDGKGLEGDAL